FCPYMEPLCRVSRGKIGGLIPGRGIIGTAEGRVVSISGRLHTGAFATPICRGMKDTSAAHTSPTSRRSRSAGQRTNHPSGRNLSLPRRLNSPEKATTKQVLTHYSCD